MEVPGRSYAWEGERMPHQRSSADGEPSSSGRLEGRRSSSGGLHLRSLAQLPRASRNGSEPLPMQPAEDAFLQADGEAAHRTTDLKARPLSLAQRPNFRGAGRRARRGSIADFLCLKSGGPSQDSSAASGCDITLHGMAMPPASGARSRRSSFLNTLIIGMNQGAAAPDNVEDAGEASLPDGAMMESVDLAKPLRALSQGRRRRASMLDLFRTMHLQSAETSVEGGEASTAGSTVGEPGMARSKSNPKPRRTSVIDFFLSNNSTGLPSGDDQPQPSSVSMTRRHFPRGDTRSQRRRSVIDILGQSSKKVFAKLMNHEFGGDPLEEDDTAVESKLWFTSLNDFKPLTFQYLSGRYSSAFFACSVKTGKHYILKKFEKEKMSLSDERGVRRALHFAELLEHEHIVQCCGLWEDEQAIYIVEEYAVKGDLLQDSMSHPEKYTEAFTATKVIKPLLDVLVYLHSFNIVHRAIFPEYVLFGREDKLKLGHFTSAIDQRMDPPTERIPFLDYMAPEMLSIMPEDACGGGGLPCVLAPPPQAAAPSGRGKGRAVRLPLASNEGSIAPPQSLLRSGTMSSAFPLSPGTPVFDFGGISDSIRASPKQQQQLLLQQRLHQQQQQLAGQQHGPTSNSGAQLLDLFGLSSLVAASPEAAAEAPSLDKSSPNSRSTIRSTLNLFRSAASRQLSNQQQQLSPLDDGHGVLYGSNVPPPPPMMMMPPRRRKSALDEMSAPWLRPVGSDSQWDDEAEAREGGDPPWSAGAPGAAVGAEALSTPVVEARSASGGPADGSDGILVATAATGSGGGGGESTAATEGDTTGGSNPRSQSQLMRVGSSPSMATTTAVTTATTTGPAAAAQLDGDSDHSPVQRLYPSVESNSPRVSDPPPLPSPLAIVQQQPQHEQEQDGGNQQGSLASNGVTMAAAAAGFQPPPLPSSPPMPRPASACRRPGSAYRPEPSAIRSGSGFTNAGGGIGGGSFGTGSQGSPGGTPLSPPLPQPGSAFGSGSHRSGLVLGSGNPEDGRRVDLDECLPGYAAEPLGPRCSTGLLRIPNSRLQSADQAVTMAASPPLSPPVTSTATAAAAAVPPPLLSQSAWLPGPVMESQVETEHTPMMPYEGSATDFADVKRTRVVSFTASGGSATASADPAAAADVYADDGRPTRSSRMAPRDLSPTSGQGGQMMMGLRTMARNITNRIGMVLGGRGDLLSPGGTSPGDSTAWGDATEVAGGGGGKELSPRPSCPGASDATTIVLPNNPWEWKGHYDEKVDLWQVGCLVHEILCLSLPFETEDKLLACALILWADIVSFPDHLSPECHDFMRACLTKNPAERPSAAELLQHPWIVRHTAGEVLKSVRQHKEDENLSALSHAHRLTVLQRAAAAVGLGWMVGAGGGGAATAATDATTSASSAAPWSPWSWMLRPWTSKVAPAVDGVAKAKDEGEAKLALAMAMVQEQQQQRQRQNQPHGSLLGPDRNSNRRSSDMEAARRSLEAIRQHQHHHHHHHHHQVSPANPTPPGGSTDSTSRWGVLL